MDLDDAVDAPSWKIQARGRTFAPPRKTTVSVYTAGFKSMIYSSKRLTYPMIREDFDPDGERNIQNRGKSGYKRISWDEATDILVSEINRVKREAGPAAILSSPSSHHMWGNVGYRHSTYFRFMNMMGFTYADHNPDSWEGWHWGGMHMWGFSWRLGNPEQYDLLEDTLQNTEMIVFWSSDPEVNTGIYAAHESTPRRFWMKDLGIKMVFIDPFYNHTAGLLGDKWLSPKIGTDHALSFAIAYTWLTEGTYDKEYVATHAHGFEEWTDYVLGKTDGLAKTCEWAEAESGVPACEIRALAREWAKKKTMLAAGGLGGWGGACRASHGIEFARGMIALATMQGMGKPGSNIYSTTQGTPVDYDFYFPGYAEGGISGDCENTAAGYQVRVAHVRRQDHLPVAFEHQHLCRPAHPAAQGARVHHGRRVPVVGQGLLRWGHTAPDAPVQLSGPRLSQDQDAVEVRRPLDRHHDGHQSLRQDVYAPEPGVRRQPVHLERGRSAVRRPHPAGLHQLRALGHQRVRQLLRLYPRHLRTVQPSRHLAAGQVHRAFGRVQV